MAALVAKRALANLYNAHGKPEDAWLNMLYRDLDEVEVAAQGRPPAIGDEVALAASLGLNKARAGVADEATEVTEEEDDDEIALMEWTWCSKTSIWKVVRRPCGRASATSGLKLNSGRDAGAQVQALHDEQPAGLDLLDTRIDWAHSGSRLGRFAERSVVRLKREAPKWKRLALMVPPD